ncbi:hypothetical protein GGF32_004354 [Allomyces javanicus]|nr:hypothetical protein GGF32_004354 [Allomyces javanicus]
MTSSGLPAAIPPALADPAPPPDDNPATALLRARAAGIAPATVVDDTHDENEIEAPFVPCSHDAVRAAVALLDPPADSIVMDLGIVSAPPRRAIGVELDRAVYDACAAHLRSVLTPTEFAHVELRCEDMYRTDLAAASHMVLYLLPACLAKLEPRLRVWLQDKANRVLVTVGYSVPAWTPDAVTPAGPVLMAFRYSRTGLDSTALA